MTLRSFWCAAILAAAALAATSARAASYIEAVSGDISNNVNSPTLFSLTPGANSLSASVGSGDVDLIHMVVPAGSTLNSIVLNTYSGPSRSFTGVQIGSTWTAGLGGSVNAAKLLGWTHFGPTSIGADVNQDILDNMGVSSFGSAGFTPPLASGDYTFEYQDTGSTVNFSMTLNVSIPPIPGDFDGNRVVDGNDLAQWADDFGANGGSDADNDTDSDGNDLLIWQRNLHIEGGGGATAVPEPATVGLCAAALSCLPRRRRP